MNNGNVSGPRCVALVGPYLSAKTTMMEAMLHAAGATGRRGSAADGTALGLASPEAKARRISMETTAVHCTFMDERSTFLDCPGSVELAAETQKALMVADLAVVVCEPAPDKALALMPLFKMLDDMAVPHVLFINKLDTINTSGAETRVRDLLQAFHGASSRPLVLRQVPIREGGQITGYVDLVSERAYRYRPGDPSDLISLPETVQEREQTARRELLEAMADYDDALLEQLLEDMAPEKEEVYRQLTKDVAEDLIVPVLLGAAETDHGVR